jgi:hypothetical protein
VVVGQGKQPSDDLDAKLEQQAIRIRDLLASPAWKWKDRALRNPEHRTNLDRLCIAIEDVRRLPQPVGLLLPERLTTLRTLLASVSVSAQTADSLGLLLETVDEELAIVGAETMLGASLEFEETRDGEPSDLWVDLWGPDRRALFNRVASGSARSGEIGHVRRTLGTWYRTRHELYVLDRSRDRARARRLLLLSPIVAALVVALIVVVDSTTDLSWRRGVLVAVAAALGATLSLAYRVRDTVPRLRDLRTLRSGFVLQAMLGAATGTIVWLLCVAVSSTSPAQVTQQR